ncbi:tyrosine-protein phosphatase [Paludisphaera soli]|uniref:tyrosine-protein phosphatase n=1 Tax=Paludisphaera soli TaxID=2712865 RepID=UPI001F106977|nr:tyrosine-protein phosphatase [Paludisphaera soli]
MFQLRSAASAREATTTSSDAPATGRARGRLRRAARILGLGVATAVAAFALRPYYSQNLGVVAPGRAYRSAQPTSGLGELIRDHGLAAILNLRGGNPEDAWYVHEVRTAREAGVDFYDLPLSAVRRPTRRELLLLIDVITKTPEPLLIHCRAGADRTGLATVVYNLMILGQPPEAAIEGFTLYHGHVPLFGPQRLHEPINEYAAWLKSAGLAHTPERFRSWVRDDYRAEDPPADPPPFPAGPRYAI